MSAPPVAVEPRKQQGGEGGPDLLAGLLKDNELGRQRKAEQARQATERLQQDYADRLKKIRKKELEKEYPEVQVFNHSKVDKKDPNRYPINVEILDNPDSTKSLVLLAGPEDTLTKQGRQVRFVVVPTEGNKDVFVEIAAKLVKSQTVKLNLEWEFKFNDDGTAIEGAKVKNITLRKSEGYADLPVFGQNFRFGPTDPQAKQQKVPHKDAPMRLWWDTKDMTTFDPKDVMAGRNIQEKEKQKKEREAEKEKIAPSIPVEEFIFSKEPKYHHRDGGLANVPKEVLRKYSARVVYSLDPNATSTETGYDKIPNPELK